MSSMFTDGEQVQPVVAPSCPRCASENTKFCYYNNYSLTQPRYFCKGCRRYWTKGGSLRNVPVGGGCRKTRRSRSRAHASHRNSADQTGYPQQGSGGDSATDSSSSSGAEIDMAAVFARYVSQTAAPEGKGKGEGEGVQLSAVDQDAQLDDLESFDYEMLLADDVFWSTTSEDGSSLTSSNNVTTGWEPMAALQELDSTPIAFAPVMDDQFTSPSANLLVDNNWSCVDLSGYGDFYRP